MTKKIILNYFATYEKGFGNQVSLIFKSIYMYGLQDERYGLLYTLLGTRKSSPLATVLDSNYILFTRARIYHSNLAKKNILIFIWALS